MTTTTLRVLREETARGHGVRSFAEGSATSTGTGGTIPDLSRLEPDGEWNDVDAYVLFTSSPNDSVARRITGFTQGLLTFAPSLSAAIASGATYQLFKTFHPIDDYNIAINDGLRELGVRRVTSVATTAEADDVHRQSVPTAIDGAIEIVKIERSVGTTVSSWNYEELFEDHHYRRVISDGTTWLELLYTPVANTLLRFTYVREATALVADTDGTYEPPLLVRALARKYLALAVKDSAAVNFWAGEAERIRSGVVSSREPARKAVVPRITIG